MPLSTKSKNVKKPSLDKINKVLDNMAPTKKTTSVVVEECVTPKFAQWFGVLVPIVKGEVSTIPPPIAFTE